MSEFLTLSQVIWMLEVKQAELGDVPVLVSADGTDDEFLRPIGNIFAINIKDKTVGDDQVCVVISNYEIEDATEDDTSTKIYTEGD